MLKSKSKILSFAAITTIFCLCFFSSSVSVLGVSLSAPKAMTGPGMELSVKNDPIRYGVIIPDINTASAFYVNGYYQADFSQLTWNDVVNDAESTKTIEGKTIENAYPWYFDDDTGAETPVLMAFRNNGMIDPWNDLSWIKTDAREAKNTTRPYPFVFNSTRNWYCMGESVPLLATYSSGIPMQIDIKIDSVGPKLLKYQDLGTAPTTFQTTLISPSGKAMNTVTLTPTLNNEYDTPSIDFAVGLFNYWEFVACETGTYTLWVYSVAATTTHLSLEFMDYESLTALTEDTLTFGGSGEDDVPNWNEIEGNEWSSVWYEIDAQKGDIYQLDIASVYSTVTNNYPAPGKIPAINIYTPCCDLNGYAQVAGAYGTNYLYAAETGKVYVAFDDLTYYSINRYSIYLNKIEQIAWSINASIESIQLEPNQVKAVTWTMNNDSFVRLNWTSYGGGAPRIIWGGAVGSIVYKTAPKEACFQVIAPVETKFGRFETNGSVYYYYYLPKGEYIGMINNLNPQFKGLMQLDSNYVKYSNVTLQPQVLGYPSSAPALSAAFTFDSDPTNPALKYAQWMQLNITKRGLYRLNTTILGAYQTLPTKGSIAKCITYDATSTSYKDVTAKAQVKDDGFEAFDEIGDIVYIASTMKWSDIHFNVSTYATAGTTYAKEVWTGTTWTALTTDEAWVGANDFQTNGSYFLYKTASQLRQDTYANWKPGAHNLENQISTIDPNGYYWFRLRWTAFAGTACNFDHISLTNFTADGDVNMWFCKDSPYEYCDFWAPSAVPDIDDATDNFVVTKTGNRVLWGYDSSRASKETQLLNTMILEPGVYKLLVVPAYWSTPYPVTLHFALEDLSGWIPKVGPYNLSSSVPIVHKEQITNGLLQGKFAHNYTTVAPYLLTVKLNTTFYNSYNFLTSQLQGMVFINCSWGDAYNWTTLILRTQNITTYTVWLIHNLDWINNNGPNNEIITLGTYTGSTLNTTIDFAAMHDNFSLLIVYNSVSKNTNARIRFRVSQWNTEKLYTVDPKQYTCVPGAEEGVTLIPSYNLYILIGSIMGISAILIRKRLKTAKLN